MFSTCLRFHAICCVLPLAVAYFCSTPGLFADEPPSTSSARGRVRVSVRASTIDSRVRAYPEIGFLIDDDNGKPADMQQAWFDPNVPAHGRLVIWLMAHNSALFERLNGYGLHAIRVHYANKWFSKCCQEKPVDPECRGNLRLEAATGIDASDEVAIAKPDSMAERAYLLVKWLRAQNVDGDWGQFLNSDGTDLDWEKVIVAGSSHGSTTASRFAKHQKVARVVALCGPRDQHQTWQSLPSATPANRFFAFSHVLDQGWAEDHYCRSWEMLGLNDYGPIVNVDRASPPYSNTRRLITDADVGGNPGRAHGAVQPGKAAVKDPDTGGLIHQPVWEYLFTHPVEEVGQPDPRDPECDHAQLKD
ncbi:BPSS1187 family protein [Rhodopirellula sallentina]|uniref:Putative secreted protein n=1 Tax=Rhodopirellula sallentina SM41 TaxID=1263870 RepID=M5TYL6_9BACT|nr:putative secreted protein [Rhodopirellula sallentina SM41]